MSDDDTAREYSGATRASITQTAPARTSATPWSIAAAKRERRAYGHARAGADSAAAVEADVVERVREAAVLARPSERQADVRGPMRRERLDRHARESIERHALACCRIRLARRDRSF